MKKYTVYITHYIGTKLPPWYIGSSYEEKIKGGYNGSVGSKKYKEIYDIEQKENKHLFKTKIISFHTTQQESLKEELRLQKMHSVVKNNRYFNESYASVNGSHGRDVSGELNPNYGNKWTNEQKNNLSAKKKNTKVVFDNVLNKNIVIASSVELGDRYNGTTKNRCSIINIETKEIIFDKVSKIDNIKYFALSKGISKNLTIIDIFDNKGKIRYTSDKTFLSFLKENDLPSGFVDSYRKEGKRLYENVGPNEKRLEKAGKLKFRNWYAIKRK